MEAPAVGFRDIIYAHLFSPTQQLEDRLRDGNLPQSTAICRILPYSAKSTEFCQVLPGPLPESYSAPYTY
jgi:hypothetical protein